MFLFISERERLLEVRYFLLELRDIEDLIAQTTSFMACHSHFIVQMMDRAELIVKLLF